MYYLYTAILPRYTDQQLNLHLHSITMKLVWFVSRLITWQCNYDSCVVEAKTDTDNGLMPLRKYKQIQAMSQVK